MSAISSNASPSQPPAPGSQGRLHAPPAGQHLPPPRLVDTPAAFEGMLAALADEPALALDTESNSLYRYFYRVCLLQISTRQTDYLVDTVRLTDISGLQPLLADARIEKVFHAAENDIMLLKRDHGFHFANVFDTMVAARILGWSRVGLAGALKEHFGIELDKREQLTDWGRRPLTAAQLSYARMDTRFLLPLRDLLARELEARKRWREAQEAFAALPAVAFVEKPFDPDGFWRMKRARDLRADELAVLRELYLWRDEQARAADRPPFKIVGDDALVQLSQLQPRRLPDLPLSPRQVQQYGKAILAAIARGRAAAPPQPPARPHNGNGRPDPEVIGRFDRLRAWRAARAAARGVEPDVVLTNDTLMAIARAAPADLAALAALNVLGDWKREEYGPELLRAIAEK